MLSFTAYEFDLDKVEPTGFEETYLAEDVAEAVEHVRYTRSLVAPARVGPLGHVVYGRRMPSEPHRGYVVIEDRKG